MSDSELKQALKGLIDRYESEIEYYHSDLYSESQLRTDFLDPFFGLLGWDISNSQGRKTNEREVIVEESLKSEDDENAKKPDYTFRLYSERKFFAEAKKPSVDIRTKPNPAKQVRRYGFTAKLGISVLSNFEYTAIYDCSEVVNDNNKPDYARIKLYHYKEYINSFEELLSLLGKDSVYSGQFDNEWSDISTKIENSKSTIDDLFLAQIKDWRYKLGVNIMSINNKISKEELNDVVQDYINSIIFLRVCEDRNIERYKTLLDITKQENHIKFKLNLEKSDKKYNSGLFKLKYIDQLINNNESCLWSILTELYYPYNSYSFSVLSSDVLGGIYEYFLGEELNIINNEICITQKDYNLNRDIVNTPNFIIKRIIDYTVLEYCEYKNDKQILASKFSDIACGSGAFLLEVYQMLQDILVDYYLKYNKNKLEQTGINQYKLKFEDKKLLLTNCIFGVDKDYNAVKACKFGLLLKLLENENRISILGKNHLLPDLDDNIFYGNSLIDYSDDFSENDLLKINPFNIHNYKFDVIVGNPPYLATEYMNSLYPEEFGIYKNKYKVADKQFDKYYLFIERAFNLLKDKGLLGYIIPSKFTKLKSAKKLREFISSDNLFLTNLISFGKNQLFKGKLTYTSIAIFKKDKNSSLLYSNVKDYKNWFANPNYKNIDISLFDNTTLGGNAWILPNKQDDIILSVIREKSLPLSDIVGSNNITNGIQTSANNEYIHSILKEDENYIWFIFNDAKYKIEKELTRPYFKTEKADSLYTYKNITPNSFVIYPYININNKIVLIDINTLMEKYPFAYGFLNAVKSKLNSRSVFPPMAENDWYKYGRHQALENCDVKQKIIVGILSKGYKYSIDNNRTFISSGGTAGYSLINIPSDCCYSIYYIQAILSSKYSEWFVSLSGEIFDGGFIARGTKIQKEIPIPKIDFTLEEDKSIHDNISNLQLHLNELYTLSISNANSRERVIYERLFNSKKQELDNMITRLYNLGELEEMIPTIEELYNS